MSQNIVPQFERLEKKTLIEVSMKDLEKKTLIEDPMEESKEPEHSHHSIANKNHSQVIELEPKVIINPNRFPQNKEGNVRDNKSAIFENNPEPNYIELEQEDMKRMKNFERNFRGNSSNANQWHTPHKQRNKRTK